MDEDFWSKFLLGFFFLEVRAEPEKEFLVEPHGGTFSNRIAQLLFCA